MTSVKIPKKVQDRLAAGLRKYQPLVRKLAERDISEADTVTVCKDILSELFGFDKYAELTSEQQIRGTFCDLAVKIEGKVHYLAEIKSAGTSLNQNHLRQAVNYGAHEGIEWVLLTNAIAWKVYRIKFGQPLDWEEVYCFDLAALSSRSADDLGKLFMLCRESISTDALKEYHRQAQILNRYVIAELLQAETLVGVLRKEIRRLFDLKATDDELRLLLSAEVIKRESLDGEPARQAKNAIKRAESALIKKRAKAAPATAIIADAA